MTLPSQLKNQQTRLRGETLGEAGADWPMGFAPKPMLDERKNEKQDEMENKGDPDKSKGELNEGRPHPEPKTNGDRNG